MKRFLILLCILSLSIVFLQRIERDATFGYSTITVPEEAAANVLYINGTLIHRAQDEIPASYPVFLEKVRTLPNGLSTFLTKVTRFDGFELLENMEEISSCTVLTETV